MNDRLAKQIPRVLVILTLIDAGAPATAGDKPTEPEQPAREQKTESLENHLRWSTATEHENFGYDVYRAESEDGPFKRINKDPILGAGTSDEPSSYEYVDGDVDPYTTYWYYLESIAMNATRERFTPVFRKKPKLTRESSDPEDAPEQGEDDPDQE